MNRLFAVLLPGSGHLLLDFPWTGTSMLFLFFCFLLTIVVGDRFIVNPLQLIPSYPATVIGGTLLTALYVYSLWHFNRRSKKLSQFLSLIRVTRREFQIKE